MAQAEGYCKNVPSDYLANALGVAAERLLELRLVKRYPVVTPAAGAEFTKTVPGGVLWEVLEIFYTFVTSAIVANRSVSVAFQDADSNYLGRFSNAQAYPAGQTSRITYSSGFGYAQGGGATAVGLPNPPYILQSGDKMLSQTSLIDVGDQISGIFITVREWSETDVVQEMMEIDAQLDALTQREVTGR